MQVAVSFLPDPQRIDSQLDVAVVIDVLRATSVMATALAAGCREIMTCRTVEEAQRIAAAIDPRPLLCGERECRPIAGFDLGNSPAEYTPAVVAGRTLVLTTTNGTAAIAAAAAAKRVLTASFLNLSATLDAIEPEATVHLVCAGTNAAITAEDVLLAGLFIDRLRARGVVQLIGDEALIAREFWRDGRTGMKSAGMKSAGMKSAGMKGGTRRTLTQRLQETQGGRNLIAAGYETDLEACAAIDSLPVVVSQMGEVSQTGEGPAIFRAGV